MESATRRIMLVVCLFGACDLAAQPQTTTLQLALSASSSTDQAALIADGQPGLTAFKDASPSAGQQSGPPSRSSRQSQSQNFRKYTFDFGFGVPTSIGSTNKYQTYGFNFQAGFGRNLNPYFGAKVEYDFNYFNIPTTADTQNNTGDVLINSISIDPYLNVNPKSRVGLYLVGGGGYNWKTTQFTEPTGNIVCAGGTCGLQSMVVASYPNDAFGFNIGGGINWKLSSFAVYTEARYVQVESQTSKVSATNPYPPAYYATDYIPITVGMRF
jgi:hypothetical protein